MDTEKLLTRLEDKMDRQHTDMNKKLDIFLDKMHNQDKKVQKIGTQVSILNKIGITIGTTGLGLLVWFVKGG